MESEKKMLEAEGQLGKANAEVERLRNELYETECQVFSLTR